MQQVTSYPQLLGQVVRVRRKRAGVDQESFGKGLGMSGSGWSRVESGDTTMTVAQLRQVARALGVTPSALLMEVDGLVASIAEKGMPLQVLDEKPPPKSSAWWLIGGAALAALVVALLAAGAGGDDGEGDSAD
jgi:transcriptional regulator with XRE-family HTH domain